MSAPIDSIKPPAAYKEPPSAAGFFEIGKPVKLPPHVDTSGILNGLIQARMHIVDIVPVYYKLTYKSPEGQGTGYPLHFELDYENAYNNYSQRCQSYGLDPVHGVRLFITDEMTANENITTQWQENKLTSLFNNLSAKFQSLQEVTKAIRSGGQAYEQKTVGAVEEVANKAIDLLGRMLGVSEETRQFASQAFHDLVQFLARGYKVAFPRTWVQSDYNSTFNLTVKLVSPYGYPSAIKEFIVKPLLYLLLMVTPESTSGIVYGNTLPVRIRAYGIADIRLACIDNITINRGGQDTSFNLYKQPLTVMVTLTARPLVPGFVSVMSTGSLASTYDYAIIDDVEQEHLDKLDEQFTVLTPSISSIIDSFRPAPRSVCGVADSIKASRASSPLVTEIKTDKLTETMKPTRIAESTSSPKPATQRLAMRKQPSGSINIQSRTENRNDVFSGIA